MNPSELIHKQLREELALYKMMVNASLDSITLIDRNYIYNIVTDAYVKSRQLKREDIVNHTTGHILSEESCNNLGISTAVGPLNADSRYILHHENRQNWNDLKPRKRIHKQQMRSQQYS